MPTKCQDLCQGWVDTVNEMRSVSTSMNSDVCMCGDGVWMLLLVKSPGLGRSGRKAGGVEGVLSLSPCYCLSFLQHEYVSLLCGDF